MLSLPTVHIRNASVAALLLGAPIFGAFATDGGSDVAAGVLSRILAFDREAARSTAELAGVRKITTAVRDSGAYTHMNHVWWMDNHRLIFNGRHPAKFGDEAAYNARKVGILIWDTRDNTIQVYQDNRGRQPDEMWEVGCFYHGTQMIGYMRREFTRLRPFKEWKGFVRRGILGAETEEVGLGAASPTPLNSRKVSNPAQHPYTCEPKPDGYNPNNLIPGRATIALLEEHGYIDIGPYPNTPNMLRDAQDLYYKVGADAPIPLDFTAGRPFGDHRYFYNASNGGYHAFIHRYQWGINPVVLFDPETGKAQKYAMPSILGARPLWPIRAPHSRSACTVGTQATRSGFIVQCAGFPEAGLYLWQPEQGDLVSALVQGEESDQPGQVSPDGCKLAFVSWKPRRIGRTDDIPESDKTLKIIDLCTEVSP